MNEYGEILDTIVNKLGKDALKNTNTARYIEDYAPKSDALVKNRLKFVFMSGIFSKFSSTNDVSNIVARLQNELFYPADLANMLVSLFAKHLGIELSSSINQNISNNTTTVNGVNSNSNLTNTNSVNDFVLVEMPPKISTKNVYFCNHQVTQQEYYNIMGTNPSKFKNPNHPVEKVSLKNAIEYCNLLSDKEGFKSCYDGLSFTDRGGYRLPKEDEWEWAAQGGLFTNGYIFSGSDNIEEVAWYYNNSGEGFFKLLTNTTHPVMQKKPNELGLYDMSGNVWEWINKYSYYNDKYPPIDCRCKGGSYLSKYRKLDIFNHFVLSKDTVSSRIGFRVVRTIKK